MIAPEAEGEFCCGHTQPLPEGFKPTALMPYKCTMEPAHGGRIHAARIDGKLVAVWSREEQLHAKARA